MELANRQSLYAATLFISGLFGSAAMADVNRIFLEDNGYIFFEPEYTDTPADWVLGSEIEGYRGAGYLEWTGADYFSKNDAGNGTITYHFRVETAGNYELRWRSRIAKGDSNTESNDSWVRFPTGSNVSDEHPLDGWTKVFMGEADTWSWSSRTVDEVSRHVRQYFNSGDHTIEISGRSYGHAIDQIALYRYADVSFDSGLNGMQPLSRIVQGDGTIIDPNPAIVPEPENVLSNRVNVKPIAPNTTQTNTTLCEANTLTLAATKAASLNLLSQSDIYNSDTLSIEPDVHSALLSFDLSLLPTFTAAKLNYSTSSSISNGSLDIYLGSHNVWPDTNRVNTPDAVVQLAATQGGWEADTRYESELDATLLSNEPSTFILSSQSGSDTLELSSTTSASSTPTLVVTGNNSFCSDWQATMTEQETSDDNGPVFIGRQSGSGRITHWFSLLLLAGLSMRIISAQRLRQTAYCRLPSR